MSSISSRVYQHPVVSIRVVSSQGASGSEYCQWDSVQSTASKRSIYNQYRWEKSQSSVYPVLTRVLLVRSIVGRANLRISLQCPGCKDLPFLKMFLLMFALLRGTRFIPIKSNPNSEINGSDWV